MPNVLQDEDYAVINSNYAISAGLNPMTDALAMEDGTSAYVNVLVCKEGNEEEPKIKALVAALQSQQVKDFMTESYGGAVVSVVEDPTDGYDPSIDYDALNGETVSCAATPAPHCEILEVCKQILADKGITSLQCITYTTARPYNQKGGSQLANMIQGYLSEVGVDVSITEYDWTTYKTKVQTDPYDICFYGWTGDNGDPDNFMNLWPTRTGP
mgnify:CR=1 FL=1